MRGCGQSYQCRESVGLCDFCMVLTGRTQICVVAWLKCCTKLFCASHKNVSSVSSLADFALKNQFST